MVHEDKKKDCPIPKIIHQIWLGSASPPVEWMESWKRMNPDWEYRLWTDDNLPKLYNQKQFDAMKEFSGKADILRIELLYQYGGLYMDADCECLNSLDDSLRQYPFFICYENELVRPGLIQNNVIGSEPGHEVLAELMQHIAGIEDINKEKAWLTVGPYLWTTFLRRYQLFSDPVDILPSHLFSPIHYEGVCYTGQDKVYATHHWTTTTGGKSNEDLRFHYDPIKIQKEKARVDALEKQGSDNSTLT